jgi:hypothetical protein
MGFSLFYFSITFQALLSFRLIFGFEAIRGFYFLPGLLPLLFLQLVFCDRMKSLQLPM